MRTSNRSGEEYDKKRVVRGSRNGSLGEEANMKKLEHHFELAFTLVELLIVITVVVVLATLILPALGPRRGPPRVKRVQMEATQIANAVQTYEADYGNFPVSSRSEEHTSELQSRQ